MQQRCSKGAVLIGALVLSIANCEHAQAQTTSQRVLLELFDAPQLDDSKWFNINSGEVIGRTRRRGDLEFLSEPENGGTTRFIRLKHHRHDYTTPSTMWFAGSEIKSRGRWKPYYNATQKVSYEYAYRMRVPRNANAFRKGLVAGAFSYGTDQVNKDDEIDIEFLGNYLTDPVTPKRLWLNTHDDLINDPTSPNVPSGIDVSQWQEYRFIWSVNNITWAMKVGTAWTTLRVVQRTDRGFPNEAQHMHFNIWAPPDIEGQGYTYAFPEAADMSYIPTAMASQDVTHYFDVDRVIITEYTSPLNARVAPTPDGEPKPEAPAAISPVNISAMEVDATAQQVRLRFTGALNAKEAETWQHYYVTANGGTKRIVAAKYEADTQSVVLQLTEKSLQVGDSVRVSAYDLTDVNDAKLADQTTDAVIVGGIS